MIFEKLRDIISSELNLDPDEVTMDSSFTDDFGADSLDLYQIVMAIEEEFDIEIDNDAMEGITTVGDAVEQISNALGK